MTQPLVATRPAEKSNSRVVATVRGLIDAQALEPHFQPVVQLSDGQMFGYEALIRTPPGCVLRNPDQLFAAARAEGLSIDLELECLRLAFRAWARAERPGRLLVNLSATALVTALARRDIESLMLVGRSHRVAPEGVIVELTEHEHVRDVEALASAVARLRRHKAAIALDDFGDGRSSLRLWSELKPELVKIDKYFTRDLASRPERVQTLRALVQIAQTFGSDLVAEGIEDGSDLHLARDLGIRLGQGWALGRPQRDPAHEVPAAALQVIRSRDVAVFPERRRRSQQRASGRTLLREVPAIEPSTTSQEVFDRFAADAGLHALAIVVDGRPVGLIGRQSFIDSYARPFAKELYGSRGCTKFANLAPRQVELHADIEGLAEILTSQDQRYLSEGIIFTEGGRYRGLGRGDELVRTVTESRIEAARHANPLTLLPGNIPLTQHIERLLGAGREFVACYADLNHFKPFNDQYGYWKGDEMILLAARCLTQHADARRDFVGHVGGDDFLVLFQSEDWQARCEAAIAAFDEGAVGLYDEPARAAGGIEAEDRHGVVRFHPLTTVSVGAVRVPAVDAFHAEDVANAAAAAKRRAKLAGVGLLVTALNLPAA